MENTEFVTDEELTDYINSSASELYDILVTKFEDYYTKDPVLFNIASGNTYNLPSDFYKLRGVDEDFGSGDFAALERFNFNQRNRRNLSINRPALGVTSKKYRIFGKKLMISPEDQATGNYRLWYIPQYDPMVNPTDELDVVMGWEEYVIVDAAIKCLQKEESDTQVLQGQKASLYQRIEIASQNRDAENPETMTDVYKPFRYLGD
jgi:hypothetical protein